jgi:hypothetical protein
MKSRLASPLAIKIHTIKKPDTENLHALAVLAQVKESVEEPLNG